MKTITILFLLGVIYCLAQSSSNETVRDVTNLVTIAVKSGVRTVMDKAQNWAEENDEASNYSPRESARRSAIDRDRRDPAEMKTNREREQFVVYTSAEAERFAQIKAEHRRRHAKEGVKDCIFCRF